jgi:hypothetical protein
MKIDKDILLKHKFWVILLVYLPLTFGAIFLLVTSISGSINQEKKKIESKVKLYVGDIKCKTPDDIAKMKNDADIEKQKETLVHAQAFKSQEEWFLWPPEVEKYFNFKSGLFAQKITLYKGEPPPGSSKNEDRLIHGKLDYVLRDYFEVTSNGKPYKFFRSASAEKIKVEGGQQNEINWEEFTRGWIGTKISVGFNRGKYFNEPLTDSEQTKYTNLGEYLKQIEPILVQVEPMTPTGEGVVQLRGWAYEKGKLPPGKAEQRFLNFLDQGWVNVQGDISEECWLAQEDIWIQKELYRLVRVANDYVSKFDNVDKKDTGDDKTIVHTFKNPFWEIGIKWSGGSKLNLTLKNLQDRKQRLDVKFKVRFNKSMDPEVIFIGGEPLGPAGSKDAVREVKDFDLGSDNPARKGVYSLDQVLTWETAAVKRIDQITIGSQAPDEIAMDHRDFADGQVPIKKAEGGAVNPPPGPGPVAPINPLPGNRPPFPGKGKRGPIGPQGGIGNNELMKHGLIRNRFLSVSPQSRRIPVAISLIVDQDHIDRVQMAFSNSKLRFLTTQVLMNRYPGSLRPQIIEPDDPNNPNANPNRPFGLPFGRGPIMPPPVQNVGDDMETNIEMVIYGIVTLYERFPPPPVVEVK